MPIIDIHVNGDGCWPDIDMTAVLHGELSGMAALPGGMTSGKPSVTLRITLDDGMTVLAETSLALLHTAVRAFVSRYGEPR